MLHLATGFIGRGLFELALIVLAVLTALGLGGAWLSLAHLRPRPGPRRLRSARVAVGLLLLIPGYLLAAASLAEWAEDRADEREEDGLRRGPTPSGAGLGATLLAGAAASVLAAQRRSRPVPTLVALGAGLQAPVVALWGTLLC